jgi:hypothetical protein
MCWQMRRALPTCSATRSLSRSKWDRLRGIRALALKYPLTALIQRPALAVAHHLLEQASDCAYVVHQSIKFPELSLRQLLPTFRGTSDLSEPEEQLPDFVQRKTQQPRSLNDGQPIQNRGIVTPLPADSWRVRKQSYPLVVANRGRLKSNLARNLGYRELSHPPILEAQVPNSPSHLSNNLQTLCLP